MFSQREKIFRYLNDDEKLALRQVNKDLRSFLRESQSTPYETKVEFMTAMTGLWGNEHDWDNAWKLYSSTLKSHSLKPAVFYKLRDPNFCIYLTINGLGTYGSFPQGENCITTGRYYCPSKHTWVKNAVWLLAQIHLGRPVTLFSPLSMSENTWRLNSPYELSALAKEVTSMVKAGWTLRLDQDLNVQLIPNPDPAIKNMKIDELINLKDNEILDAVKKVEKLQAAKFRISRASHILKIMFANLPDNYLFYDEKNKLENCVNDVFLNCLNQLDDKDDIDQVIKLFNLYRVADLPRPITLKEKDKTETTDEYIAKSKREIYELMLDISNTLKAQSSSHRCQ